MELPFSPLFSASCTESPSSSGAVSSASSALGRPSAGAPLSSASDDPAPTGAGWALGTGTMGSLLKSTAYLIGSTGLPSARKHTSITSRASCRAQCAGSQHCYPPFPSPAGHVRGCVCKGRSASCTCAHVSTDSSRIYHLYCNCSDMTCILIVLRRSKFTRMLRSFYNSAVAWHVGTD